MRTLCAQQPDSSWKAAGDGSPTPAAQGVPEEASQKVSALVHQSVAQPPGPAPSCPTGMAAASAGLPDGFHDLTTCCGGRSKP